MSRLMNNLLSMAVVTVVLLASQTGFAETATDSLIDSLSSLTGGGSDSGSMTTLLSALSGVASGSSSPTSQYVITNLIFTSCANSVVSQSTDPTIGFAKLGFTKATAQFNAMQCAMYDCFVEAYLVSSLATTSSNTSAGGQSSPANQCQMQKGLQQILQSAQSSQSCPGTFPAALINIISNPNNGSTGNNCNG